jgi:uncharacterized protein (TIGR03083 family)
MSESAPIQTANLFSELNGHLIRLLRSLAPEDWRRPTVCSRWNVQDIASHLLDGNIRRLSAQRDGYFPPDAPRDFDSYESLVAYLDHLNSEWTAATRRMSPTVLIDLLERTGDHITDLVWQADPLAPALFPVAWAGESESKMWFDIAREYTERWHHQRQIADALDRPTPIDEAPLYHPVLETFLLALPYTFRDVAAPTGAQVTLEVRGPAGGLWTIERDADAWRVTDVANDTPVARAVIDQAIAWKVFTKRRTREEQLARFPSIELSGDVSLAGKLLEHVAIMA